MRRYRQTYAASAALYSKAFAADPKLADDLGMRYRYSAACSAAMAGCGQGKDAAALEAGERARLRGQALLWLRAELDARRAEAEKEPDKVRPTLQQRIQHWRHDSDFHGVRSAEGLAKLPEAERQAWQKLWQQVEELGRGAVGGK